MGDKIFKKGIASGGQGFDFPHLFEQAGARRGPALSVEFKLDGEGEEFPRALGRMPLTAEEWRRHCEFFRDVDRRRFMLAEALVEAKRACLAMAESMDQAGAGPGKPGRARDDEARKLWKEMEEREAKPQEGWEPDLSDPASPEASPEIADWNGHWPSEGGEAAPPEGFAKAFRRMFRK